MNYDANGNALAVNAFALAYDMENRLATATAGTAVESYYYDESNHRVEKKNGTNDYLYFYGPGGKLLSIRSVSAGGMTSMLADRVYFGGMPIGSAGGYGTGDTSTLTDRLGTAVAGYPHGTDVGSVTAGNDQPDFRDLHAGWDDGIRVCDEPVLFGGLGRFLSVDPYGGSAHTGTPQSWNRYMYTWGDPINNTDPAGPTPRTVTILVGRRAITRTDKLTATPAHLSTTRVKRRRRVNRDLTARSQSILSWFLPLWTTCFLM